MIGKPASRCTVAALLALIFMVTLAPSVLAAGAAATEGRQVYNTYCVLCYGSNLVNIGSNTPDLRKFSLAQKSRFIAVVTKGKGQGKMPAWGDILSPEQIDKIWAYMRTRGKL